MCDAPPVCPVYRGLQVGSAGACVLPVCPRSPGFTALGGEVALEMRLGPALTASIGFPIVFLTGSPEATKTSYVLAGGGLEWQF